MIKKIFTTYCNIYSIMQMDKFSGKFSKFPKVLFYHGVENNIIDEKIQCIQLKFDVFERQMNYLKKRNFEIISINEFEKRFEEKRFNGNEIILTFDDGYRNNKDIVFPFLDSLGFPFSVFVSTHHIQEGLRFPPYTVRSIVYFSDKKELSLESIKTKLPISNLQQKKVAEQKLINYIKSEPIDKVNSLLSNLRHIHSQNFMEELDSKFISEKPMSWDDIRFLHNNGVEIGSHCHDHILVHQKQTEKEVSNQFKISKQIIEKEVGTCKYLVYPNGRKKDVSDNSMKIAQRAGYSLSFSTWMKSVSYTDNKMFVPRYIAPNCFSEFVYLINNIFFDKLNEHF